MRIPSLRDFNDVSTILPPPVAEDIPGPGDQLLDRSIGDFLRQLRRLNPQQVDEILDYQRNNGVRFGEAAVALKYASREDVLWALSQQFHYPYAGDNGDGFNPELVAAVDPFSKQTEAFRGIRSQLLMSAMGRDHRRRALAVMSPNVGDGRSYFAANLAIVFSQLGGRTLLVDADMRTPRQHMLFNVPNDTGLSSLLAGRTEANEIKQVRDLPSLLVLPVGTLPPNPLELLERTAFGLLMHELMTKFDHVIVDTPSATHGMDSRVLAGKCGSALVLGRRGTSRMKAMHGLISDLGRGSVQCAGVVVNDH
ncbi:chain length determinant protein tyrosine kinase EpsG [soil metagenome]